MSQLLYFFVRHIFSAVLRRLFLLDDHFAGGFAFAFFEFLAFEEVISGFVESVSGIKKNELPHGSKEEEDEDGDEYEFLHLLVSW